MVLICIFLMANDTKYLSCAYWPFVQTSDYVLNIESSQNGPNSMFSNIFPL